MWKCNRCGTGSGVPSTHKCRKADIKRHEADQAKVATAEDIRALKRHVELFTEFLNAGNLDKATFHGNQIASYVKCGLSDLVAKTPKAYTCDC